MKRVRMVVSYDGTAYRGWQLQPNGITIEEVLNRELTALLKEPISVIGASRSWLRAKLLLFWDRPVPVNPPFCAA